MRIVTFVVLLLAAACGPNQHSGVDYSKFPRPPNEVVLGVGDVVEVNVWEQKDLTTEATIRPDGTITMPLVGDLKARGKTPSQLRNDIKTALTNFLKLQAGNEVTVAVKSFNSYRFTVNGEVSRPGLYTNGDYLRAADAIALAGGPTRFAKRSDIRILRRDAKGNQLSIPIDFDLVASGKRPDMNIWILADDVIYVP
ncbi:MAG TPA: polysaccharide biosynthesis/export family protein [Kofleriaceae bacterium]|nr:polysaccharide biosynthesis/export family protein [Kofleriaceae bacterium]